MGKKIDSDIKTDSFVILEYQKFRVTRNPNLIWWGFYKVNSDMKSVVIRSFLTHNISIVNTNLLQNQ